MTAIRTQASTESPPEEEAQERTVRLAGGATVWGGGWYNSGFRDYSPMTMRFTTTDPVRSGSNWYAYVGGDPVNYVDPWGLRPVDLDYGAIGAGCPNASDNAAAKPLTVAYVEEPLEIELPGGMRSTVEIGDTVPRDAIINVPSDQILELTDGATPIVIRTGDEDARVDVGKMLDQIKKEEERQRKEASLVKQGLKGAGEIVLGVGAAVLVTVAVAAADATTAATMGVAAPAAVATKAAAPLGLAFGSALVADGTQQLVWALQGQESPTILSVLLEAVVVDPIVDLGEGLNEVVRSQQQ